MNAPTNIQARLCAFVHGEIQSGAIPLYTTAYEAYASEKEKLHSSCAIFLSDTEKRPKKRNKPRSADPIYFVDNASPGMFLAYEKIIIGPMLCAGQGATNITDGDGATELSVRVVAPGDPGASAQ